MVSKKAGQLAGGRAEPIVVSLHQLKEIKF